MTIIDPTTPIGKIRLRIADTLDISYLSDSTIQSTLDDCDGNLKVAARTCALYILGQLAHKSHRKMAQLEVWGAEAFNSYKEFLMLTASNPSFMDFSPVPYSSSAEFSPILDFQKNWNASFVNGTEAQQLAFNADLSPNDGSRTGFAR